MNERNIMIANKLILLEIIKPQFQAGNGFGKRELKLNELNILKRMYEM